MLVENSIGRIKQYARMRESSECIEDELNCEMHVIADLVNLHLMICFREAILVFAKDSLADVVVTMMSPCQ